MSLRHETNDIHSKIQEQQKDGQQEGLSAGERLFLASQKTDSNAINADEQYDESTINNNTRKRPFNENEELNYLGYSSGLQSMDRRGDGGGFTILPCGVEATWHKANTSLEVVAATVTFTQPDAAFCMIGRAKVKCLQGSADVLGHQLLPSPSDNDDDGIVVISPYWSSWISFHPHGDNDGAFMPTKLRFTSINRDGGGTNGNCSSFRLVPPTRSIVIPQSWRTTVDQIVTSTTEFETNNNQTEATTASDDPFAPDDNDIAVASIIDGDQHTNQHRHTKQQQKQVVLICGAKGVGKSTLLRYLTNRLLSSSCSNNNDDDSQIQQVAIVDADVGQPELSPPGMLRLCIVDQPLLQPPYWNLLPLQESSSRKVVGSIFYGSVTSKLDPTRYIAGVQALVKAYRDYVTTSPKSIPLLINMDGWIKGLGYEILSAIINSVEPSHICQIVGETKGQTFDLPSSPILEERQPSLVFTLDACTKHISSSPCIIPASTLRTIRLGVYFAPHLLRLWDNIDIADAKDLQTGYCWEQADENDGECTIANYLASERPYCVPFEAVQCCWCSSDIPGGDFVQRGKEDRLLQAINGGIVGLTTNDDNCLGLGIVRSIDWKKQLFYILTQVNESVLPQVTKLVGGQITLPAPFLFRGIFAESFLYMTMPKTGDNNDGSDIGGGVLGTEPMKSKHTIGRRSLMGIQQQPHPEQQVQQQQCGESFQL